MTVTTEKVKKPKKYVCQMAPNQAFQLGGYWYIPISMNEESIGRDFQDFWEMHAETVPGYHPPRTMENAFPCFRLSSSSFVYLDGDLEVEDYGVPSVSIALS